jgi:hypothetical protein
MEVHSTPDHAGHVGNFLRQTTAGLPNWAWLLIIAGGIAAAIILPKYLKPSSVSSSNSPGGLGLAVDPTTGLPYAVEGLVPSGAGVQNTSSPPPVPTPQTTIPPNNAGIVRTNSPLFTGDTYEAAHPQGVQTYDKPGGTPSGYLPYGSNVSLQSSTPVESGQPNPSVFFQLSNGNYVLAQDLSNVTGRGSTGPSWPSHYTRSRHFRVQT